MLVWQVVVSRVCCSAGCFNLQSLVIDGGDGGSLYLIYWGRNYHGGYVHFSYFARDTDIQEIGLYFSTVPGAPSPFLRVKKSFICRVVLGQKKRLPTCASCPWVTIIDNLGSEKLGINMFEIMQ